MSAAVACGKPARIAPNAAYSIVVSSDTRNTATLAIQNTGHGDAAVARCACACPCACPWASLAASGGTAEVGAVSAGARAVVIVGGPVRWSAAGWLPVAASARLQV